MPKLEFAFAISPSLAYLSQVRVFAESLRRLGDPYDSAIIHVCIGADCELINFYEVVPWTSRYPIRWHWAEREDFLKYSYSAQTELRYKVLGEAEFSILCDADMIFLDRFDELIENAERGSGFFGTMAFASPFAGQPERTNDDWWQYAAELAGVKDLPLDEEYPLPGMGGAFESDGKNSPPYFNYGFILGRPADFKRIDDLNRDVIAKLTKHMKSRFYAQTAFTLANYKLGIPMTVVDTKYNFPNLPLMETERPDSLEDARVAHFAVTNVLDRDEMFCGREAGDVLANRNDLSGLNLRIQQRYRELREDKDFHAMETWFERAETVKLMPPRSACVLELDPRFAERSWGPFYLLCGDGERSFQRLVHLFRGTHLLGTPNDQAGALRDSSRKHWPVEHPHRYRCDWEKDEYLSRVLAEESSGNGVFGFSIPEEAFDETLAELDRLPPGKETASNESNPLARHFPGIKAITLDDRKSLFRSNWKSRLQKLGMEVLPLTSSEMERNPEAMLKKVFEFLGVSWAHLRVAELEK